MIWIFFGHRDFLYFCHRCPPDQSRRSTPRSQRYSPRKSTKVLDTDLHRLTLFFICHRRRPEQSRRSTQRSQRYSPRKSTEVFDTDLRRLTLFFICHRAAERAQRCSQLRVLGEHSSQSEPFGCAQDRLFQNATPSTTRAYRPSIKLTAWSTPLR